MVIAESVSEAKNAAERVRVDFEPLPAVTDTVAAAGADARSSGTKLPRTSASMPRLATPPRPRPRSRTRHMW